MEDEYRPPRHFGEFINRIRIARRFGLRAFCKATGFDASYWSKIERGLASHHSGQIPEIANALNLSDDVLFAAEASIRAHQASMCSIWALEDLLTK